MKLQTERLSVQYGQTAILKEISFTLESGDWLMVAGPNGVGKSTLIGALAQSVAYEGRVTLDGRELRRMRPRERAQKIGVLTQRHSQSYGFTVEEVVRMGCYAQKTPSQEHVEEALRITGLETLRERSIQKISGGELQRCYLAQVFAQNPAILLLDEPTNHLDLQYQKMVFELVQDWLRVPERAAVSVVHDLSLAKVYGNRVMLLNRGCMVAEGSADQVLEPEKLDSVYQMDVYGWMDKMYRPWRKDNESLE